jgi:uncharacterized membrane protein
VIRAPRPRLGGEDGTILLLSLGFCLMALLLVFAVVDASAVFLARRDLAAAVDGTALAAAEQIDVPALYRAGTGEDLLLDRARVQATVAAYVSRTYPAALYPAEQISGDASGDLRSVVVRGVRTVRLPVFGRVTVHAEARAASRARP